MAKTIPPLEKKYVKNCIAQLNSSIQNQALSASEKEETIRAHITAVENDPQFRLDPEFPPSLDWFNTPAPLSFSDQLVGKMVVLDFFTYCCINCIHILPQLHELERRHSTVEGVVVVGVHSAKFGNEKVSENIRNAIERYGITHAVVNDVQIELWERLGVTCWPTLVIISPKQQLLHYIIGEGHGEELQLFMDVAVRYYKEKGGLSDTPIPVGPGEVRGESGEGLRYPGKVCFDDNSERLFVADSSNHRVLVVQWKTGKLLKTYGSGEAGFRDGSANSARFNSPQGLAYSKETLYVADTENHALRKIELTSGEVTTLAGTGRQGNDKEGGKVGVAQEISSPWDVEMGKVPGLTGESEDKVVYVAMAGTHQLWVHFLHDTTWSKGRAYPAGTSVRLSGSGEEANRNNSYPHKAAFAQPSGVTLSPDGTLLYVADSESSTVRGVALPGGSVKALVGGAIDPLDLFAFGDKDGKGREVRLQHPLGVACRKSDGVVYVADSYNHKIKVVNPSAKTCVTVAGKGSPGMEDGGFEHAQFSEPGGVCLDAEGKLLVVADTNNHAIRVLDLEKEKVSKYTIVFEDSRARLTGKRAAIITLEPLLVPAKEGRVELKVVLAPPTSCHWTEDAPSAWQPLPEENAFYSVVEGEKVHKLSEAEESNLVLETKFKEGEVSQIQVEAALYFCEDSSEACHMHSVVLCLPLRQSSTCGGETIHRTISYSPPL